MSGHQLWIATTKKILLGLLILLAILGVIALIKIGFDQKKLTQVKEEQKQQEQDRQAADVLVERLNQLKTLQNELVHPQVELNIKF